MIEWSEHEEVVPDMMVMAKGLSGGYLRLAITLISEKLFSLFDGPVAEGKSLAYGVMACSPRPWEMSSFLCRHYASPLIN
jgi:adenosylmethionine-8-amino-7-oxononanoate aminotransferase